MFCLGCNVDGVYMPIACCAVGDSEFTACKNSLLANSDRYCPLHADMELKCGITVCSNEVPKNSRGKNLACSTPAHQQIFLRYKNRRSSRAQSQRFMRLKGSGANKRCKMSKSGKSKHTINSLMRVDMREEIRRILMIDPNRLESTSVDNLEAVAEILIENLSEGLASNLGLKHQFGIPPSVDCLINNI